MADEITLQYSVSVVNGNLVDAIQPRSARYSMNAIEKFETIVATSTAEADITFTGITTPTVVVLENLDSTNEIIWGPKSAGSMVELGRLKAKTSAGGREAVFQIGTSVTITYKSAAGTPKLRIRAWG